MALITRIQATEHFDIIDTRDRRDYCTVVLTGTDIKVCGGPALAMTRTQAQTAAERKEGSYDKVLANLASDAASAAEKMGAPKVTTVAAEEPRTDQATDRQVDYAMSLTATASRWGSQNLPGHAELTAMTRSQISAHIDYLRDQH